MTAEFSLDTSGAVFVPQAPGLRRFGDLIWSDLSPFAQGYVEGQADDWPLVKCEAYACNGRGFVSENNRSDNPCKACGATGKIRAGFRHLHPEALAMILGDCEAIQAHYPQYDMVEHGHGVWKLRQTGYWPQSFPPQTVFLNDAGLVCLRERDQ